jgi:hypothetical protein
VIQHPYGETDADTLVPGSGEERGYISATSVLSPP